MDTRHKRAALVAAALALTVITGSSLSGGALGSRNDPPPTYRFLVEIDGLPSTSFVAVSGLGSETEVIEYREGTDTATRLIPGQTHPSPVVLKRGITGNLDLWNWYETTKSGNPDRRAVSIVVLNAQGEEVVRYNLYNAWIAKYEGPTLNARANEVAMETVELVHEGMDVEVG